MDSKIPCLDLTRQHKMLKAEMFEAFEKVYDKTAFSGGPFVEEFEKKFAGYTGAKYAIGVSNGTIALHLAMLALGIGRGTQTAQGEYPGSGEKKGRTRNRRPSPDQQRGSPATDSGAVTTLAQ